MRNLFASSHREAGAADGGGGHDDRQFSRPGTLQPSFMMEHLRIGKRLRPIPGAPCCFQVGVPNLTSIYWAGRSREGST